MRHVMVKAQIVNAFAITGRLLPIHTPKAMHLAMCSTSVGVVQKLHFGCLLMFVLRLHSDMEDVEATVYVTFPKAFARFYRNRQLVPLWC